MESKILATKFVLRRWKDKESIVEIILSILGMMFKVINSIFAVLLASRIIFVIENTSNYKNTLQQVLTIVTLYVFLKIMEEFLAIRRHLSTFYYRILELPDLFLKLIKLPLSQVEGSSGKKDFEKASEAVESGNNLGVEGLIKNLFILTGNIACLVAYIILSVRLNPLIMIVLVITGSLRIFKDRTNRKWILKNQDEKNIFAYERAYLHRKSLNIKLGKDARIYNMKKWFTEKFNYLCNRIMAFNKTNSQTPL